MLPLARSVLRLPQSPAATPFDLRQGGISAPQFFRPKAFFGCRLKSTDTGFLAPDSGNRARVNFSSCRIFVNRAEKVCPIWGRLEPVLLREPLDMPGPSNC